MKALYLKLIGLLISGMSFSQKTVKKVTVIIILLLFSNIINSQTLDNERVKSISQSWASAHNLNSEIANIICKTVDDEPLLYIINFKKGWVMISADESLKPVLGFSFDTNYSEENEPDAIKSLFEFYRFVKNKNRANNIKFTTEWESIESNNLRNTNDTEEVEPLIPVLWNQDWPYNAYCPLDPDMPENFNGHHNTSCGPTAFAQILRYWYYPVHGIGYHSYTYDDLGFVEADFGSTYYNWNNMPVSLDFDDPEPVYTDVATLMLHAAVSVDGAWGGGSAIHNYAAGAVKYFGYSPTCEVYFRDDYTTEEWHSIFRQELDSNRPILIAGSSEQGGHYFVCDGYYGEDFYHINWGWGGNGNGYFPLYELSWYTLNNYAIIGLEPNYQNKKLILNDPYTVDDNTVALLHFDGDLTNQSTLSNDPNEHGTISFADNSELGLGQCLYLDNSNQGNQSYIDIADNNNLDLSGDWTIEMWFKPTSFGDVWYEKYTLLNKPGDNENFESNYSVYILPTSDYYYANALKCAYYPTDQPDYYRSWINTDRDFLELGNWYHISYIRNTSNYTHKIVIHNSDRELVHYSSRPYIAEAASQPLLNSNPLFIGSSDESNTYFDGYIDELRISNVVREFEIISTELTLLVPNGGESWQSGSTQQISWSCVNIENLKLEYSTNNGESWEIISNSVDASLGQYDWLIPNIISQQCLIKITDTSNDNTYRISQNVFEIGELIITSIYDIQYTTEPGTSGTYPSLLVGETVTTSGIVSAIGYSGNNNNFFISSTDAEAWKGIYIYNAGTEPDIGDLVEVYGEVYEYYGFTEIHTPDVTVLSSGNPVPEPILVNTGNLIAPVNAEAYEGCLIKLENVTVTQEPDGQNQWYVDDGTGECQVDDMIFEYSATLDEQFEYLIGAVDYDWDEYGINPRFEADIFQDNAPSNPNPEAGATNISIYTNLRWTNGNNTETVDLYFDTNNPPVDLVLNNVPAVNFYDPDDLNAETTYYWQVICKNSIGSSEGQVWSFTTELETGIFSNQIINDLFIIYPNPASDEFYIETRDIESQQITVEILNISGKIIYNKTVSINTVVPIDTDDLKKGIYFIKVRNEKYLQTKKLIIK